MHNFQFYNPVKIIFGKGQIAELARQVSKDARVMLTFGGGSIFKNGVYHQVKAALHGYKIVEFGGIEPNPSYETLMKAVELGRPEKVDFLLAVGGGPVIGGTWFIAAAILCTGDAWEVIVHQNAYTTALSIGTVLGIPAKISAYGLGHDTIDKIVERLEVRGMNYGEHSDITPAVVRQILEKSL